MADEKLPLCAACALSSKEYEDPSDASTAPCFRCNEPTRLRRDPAFGPLSAPEQVVVALTRLIDARLELLRARMTFEWNRPMSTRNSLHEMRASVLGARRELLLAIEGLAATRPGERRTCYACAHCGLDGPDGPLVCGHKDAGRFGTTLSILDLMKGIPLPHCPDFSKFEQHPGRNLHAKFLVHEEELPDGSFEESGTKVSTMIVAWQKEPA